MSKPDLRLLAVVLFLLATLAACGSGASTAGPSVVANSPSRPAGGTTGAASPVVSPSPDASPSAGGAAPTTATACLTLGQVDCLRAAAAAVDALGADDPEPIYVMVGPFGCRTGERCVTTLAARPEGDVLVEFAGVPAASFHIAVAADGSLSATRSEASGIIVSPSSAPLGQPGPIPFTLAHCGLYSGIDVDGSWWDPVGIVDAEHPDSVNSAPGVFAFADPTHARFTSESGFIVQLIRREGSKHLPFCM